MFVFKHRSKHSFFALFSLALHAVVLGTIFYLLAPKREVPSENAKPAVLPGVVAIELPALPMQTTAPAKAPGETEHLRATPTPVASSASSGAQASLIGTMQPEYPRASRERNEEGSVLLAFDVDTEGHTTNARVTESSGYERLDKAALDALAKSTFHPAREDGKAIASHTELRIRFELKRQ